MQVSISIGSQNTKVFSYEKDGRVFSKDVAGTLLCKFLNVEWDCFLNTYGIALYAQNEIDEEKYSRQLAQKFSELDPEIRDALPDILPVSEKGLAVVNHIYEITYLICTRINKGQATYDYFSFVLSNFYGYRPPYFPLAEYDIAFLNYLCPLVEKYCPKVSNEIEYRLQIAEMRNISSRWDLDIALRNLSDYLLGRTDGLSVAEKHSAKKLSAFIMAYCSDFTIQCMDYIHFSEWEDDQEKVQRVALDDVNKQTNFSAIRKLCQEASLSDAILIDKIYDFNASRTSHRGVQKLYLNDAADLIFHSVLFCFKDNTLPIIKCKYCHKYFPRQQNSQVVCRSCKDISSKPQKAVSITAFGFDIDSKLNNIYRRLCYKGSGCENKLCYERYATRKYNLTKSESTKLVRALMDIVSEHRATFRTFVDYYLGITEDYVRNDYAEFVLDWFAQVDKYYKTSNIEKLIYDMHKAEGNCRQITLKIFILEGNVSVCGTDYVVNL